MTSVAAVVGLEEAIGIALREARRQLGLTLRDLAELGGCNFAFLSQVENGKRGASIRTLDGLAAAVQLPLSELVRRAEAIMEGERDG